MFYQIKCSICGARIKKSDFIGITGEWPGMLGGLLNPRGFKQTWPFLRNCKMYCKSCFNKKFKKTK